MDSINNILYIAACILVDETVVPESVDKRCKETLQEYVSGKES